MRQRLMRSLAVNGLITLTALAVLIWLSPGVTWRIVPEWLVFALGYSVTIGGLAQLMVPPFWRWAHRLGTLPSIALLIPFLLLVAAVGTALANLFFVAIGLRESVWLFFGTNYRIAAFITLLAGGGTVFYYHQSYLRERAELELKTRELERERAVKLATEARLASLESRIHPHFLFNTLNSISSLIREDPAKAEQMVARMAALLRFALDAPHAGLVTLEKELEIVRSYLEIERERFGDRLRYSIAAPEETKNWKVPPLSVQTLVENSVKYAISPKREGGTVDIAAQVINNKLLMNVTDDGPGFSEDAILPGHGLDLLRSRLQTLFTPNGVLRIVKGGVELEIPA